MPTYIAMLRGINVSGQKIIKMERLRASFENLGFTDVKTYVQSGNVVFKAAKISADGLAKKIAKMILDDFGFEVSILVRTPAEFESVLKRNPFTTQAGAEDAPLYVAFLSGAVPKGAEELLKPLATAGEKLVISGSEIYLQYPKGYGETKLSNAAIEKKLALRATTRNWRTVNALVEMTQT
jgi:uncharacterized protein (DUF1697 family)